MILSDISYRFFMIALQILYDFLTHLIIGEEKLMHQRFMKPLMTYLYTHILHMSWKMFSVDLGNSGIQDELYSSNGKFSNENQNR